MKIQYFEQDDELKYEYVETVHLAPDSRRRYRVEGTVPEKVINRGSEAIKSYVERKVRSELSKKKRADKAHDTFARCPNIVVETIYRDIPLRGIITYADYRLLVVQMEEPYQAEHFVNFGWASAMMGHYVYSAPTTLSPSALAAARKLLVQIYQRERQKEKKRESSSQEIVDLATRLNLDS